MTMIAPGVNVTVTAAPPSPSSGAQTGTWFVTGQTAAGPTGIPIPISSMAQYATILGSRVSYGFLYDSLNEYFNDGGVLAYVSRLVGPSAGSAVIALKDASAVNTLTLTAAGAGAWGNSLTATVAAGSVSNSYTITINQSGTILVQSPNLFNPADAVTWFAAQPIWNIQVIVTNDASATVAPGNNPVAGTFTFAGGSDDTADVTETQWTNALAVFTAAYGPGQVSAPGHTTSVGYQNLINHAYNYNRYALLDVADNANASSLVTQAQACQTNATIDPSYGALFAPWIILPSIVSTTPGSASPIPNRSAPPCSLAAAKMATNDQLNDANTPVAGSNGASNYAIGVTQSYSTANRATLNGAGINLIKIPYSTTQVTIYGNVSLALDPNWQFLSNARFRMQVINDFDEIGEGFIFDQIDGQNQLFGHFGAALAGKCQQYWIDGSIFGLTPAQAFLVNTGPQVNTLATIAAGQINAIVSLIMSPSGNYVNINVVKYSVVQSIPTF